jgi:hypothetical protein
MAPKHFLNNVTIPSPCNADWNQMIGNDQVRFCEHCKLDVHNLSQMTRNQAERLVARANGRLCARYHYDPAGRPITLPVSQKLHRLGRRVSRIAAGAFTATLSVSSAVAQQSVSSQSVSLNPSTATQTTTPGSLNSSIVGTISDQNGAVIPGATISISNDQMPGSLYASTDFNGQFKIESLEAGYYRLRIEAPGFAADDNGLFVAPDAELRADRTMKVAEIQETVEIQGEQVREFTTGGVVSFVAPADPFIRAAQEDNMETLTALISGIDINKRDERSNTTALEHAVRNANREMVQLLLSSGASVNARNSSGQTVLMMLDVDATSDLVWDLINAGAHVKLKDEAGNTALMQAATTDNLEALKTLLDAGAEVDTKNKEGQTALMLAASEGYVNAVRALVLAGADINAKDEDDEDALSLAAQHEHPAVVRFLKSKGAFAAVAKVEKEQ